MRENYSFSEMIQFVRMLRGEIVLPPEIKELAGMDARFEPLPGIGDFANVDVVLGLHTRFHLGHVVQGECSLEDAIVTGPHGLQIVPAASGIKRMASL